MIWYVYCYVTIYVAGANSDSGFSFLRFIDTSPAEMNEIMQGGLLVRYTQFLYYTPLDILTKLPMIYSMIG